MWCFLLATCYAIFPGEWNFCDGARYSLARSISLFSCPLPFLWLSLFRLRFFSQQCVLHLSKCLHCCAVEIFMLFQITFHIRINGKNNANAIAKANSQLSFISHVHRLGSLELIENPLETIVIPKYTSARVCVCVYHTFEWSLCQIARSGTTL